MVVRVSRELGGERQLTQATLLPPLISCQGSPLAKPHGSRRTQKPGWWPTPWGRRPGGEGWRMELGLSGSCPERCLDSSSSGVQEEEWTPTPTILPCSPPAGFLPSDAGRV